MKLLFTTISLKQANILIFSAIPVLFIMVVMQAHYGRGPFYLMSIDPEYFYMYNSILLGAGNLSLQYFAHPGTPLHFIIAISSRITDLFQPGDYMENFVNDPEKYIHAASLFLNMLIAITLFICGWLTLKFSGSYLAAFVIQLSPFASFSLLTMSGRLIPETLMMIPLLFLGLMVIKNSLESENDRNIKRDMVLYSLIIAFGMACKLTFIPVIILPLIMLKTTAREKLKVIPYTLIFFIIFAYPVIINLKHSWDWISGIFTHSGKYGTGDANFIDMSSVGKNIRYMISFNSGLLSVMIAALIIAVLLSVHNIKKMLHPDPGLVRGIFSIIFTLLFCAVFVLKHFELYYFQPFTIFKNLLIVLLLFLVLKLLPITDSKVMKPALKLILVLVIGVILTGQVQQFRQFISTSEEKSAIAALEAERILNLVDKDSPIILTSPYYGSPFIEFAHYGGFVMSDNFKGYYKSYLKQKFPNCYKYNDWSEKFYFWDDFVDFTSILAKVKSSVYIYIGKGNSGDLAKIEQRIGTVFDLESTVTRILYSNPETGEQLIEIIVKN